MQYLSTCDLSMSKIGEEKQGRGPLARSKGRLAKFSRCSYNTDRATVSSICFKPTG
jgi:hypothetical protein